MHGQRLACRVESLLLQFVKDIAALEDLAAWSIANVVGLVSAVGAATTKRTRYDEEVRKRSITLIDDSMCSIDITIWGAPADGIGFELEQVIPLFKLLNSSESFCNE